MMQVKCKHEKMRFFAEWVIEYFDLRRGKVKIIASEKWNKNAAYAYPACDNHGVHLIVLHMPRIKERGGFVLAYLAHELTHVKQYEQNALKFVGRTAFNPEHVIWKNKQWFGDEENDHDYFFNPWEIEARYMESPLTWFYEKHLKELGWKKSKRLEWYIL